MNPRKPNPLILPVYVPTFLLAFSRGMLIPVLPIYAKSFDIGYGLIGLVLAAEGIGTLAADVPAGVLIRMLGRKWAMVLGVTCVALSALGLYWAATVVEVILCRIGSGIGVALWTISRHAYVADVTQRYQRGRALSLLGGTMRIGIFAGPAAGGAIGSLFSLRAPFLVYAGLAAITAVISALSIEAAERDEAVHTGGHLGQLLHVVKGHYRTLATAGSGQLFAQAIRAGRHIIIPLYGADVLGLTVQSVGWIVSISSFVDMCMFYPAGLVMDRFGRKFAIVPCFLTQAVGMSLIPLTTDFTGLLLASSLVGLGNGFGAGSMMTLGADLAPKGAVGEFLGLWRLIGDGGNMGGPLAVGGVADVLSLSAATLAISGIGLLAAGTFALLVPETLTAPSPPARSPGPGRA